MEPSDDQRGRKNEARDSLIPSLENNWTLWRGDFGARQGGRPSAIPCDNALYDNAALRRKIKREGLVIFKRWYKIRTQRHRISAGRALGSGRRETVGRL